MYGLSEYLPARERMSTWLTVTLAIAILIMVPTVRTAIRRAMRKRQPKLVEKPNSYYTPKLVLDRDSRDRWHLIDLQSVHEINRDEVRRLVDKVDALGIDNLTSRERIFLDRMAELYAPAQPAHKRWSGKRLVLFIGLPIFLLAGAGLGAMFTGALDSILGTEEHKEVERKVERRTAVFHDLPELLVNLNTTGARATFLKITVSLELEKPDDVSRIKEVMPRILDNFQVYLRELRLDDLRGSAGMYRLREELLARVNASVAPVKVRDVLFKEMLVQ